MRAPSLAHLLCIARALFAVGAIVPRIGVKARLGSLALGQLAPRERPLCSGERLLCLALGGARALDADLTIIR